MRVPVDYYFSSFKTLNPTTNQWEVVDIPAPKGSDVFSLHKYGRNPFVFAVQPEEWVRENNQPLIYVAAKIHDYDYDCYFWHPEHGYQKGRMLCDTLERCPEWAKADRSWL